MAGCCDPSGYPGAFNRKTAERSARSFARKGLDTTAAPMVEALRRSGLTGASVIEAGAGSGSAIASMLGAGARSAIAVDISPNYEETARRVLAERGVGDAVEWRTGDFVALAPDLPVADVVFLNRVICCYPDMEGLVGAATDRSRRLVALSYPRRRLLVRIFIRVANTWLRLNRNSFRVFVHDPREVLRRVEAAGFTLTASGSTPAWTWNVWVRPAPIGG